ncbi:protein-glutamate O-methyltransferase CheR [Sulfurimonas sp. SAG-AH-194-C21]|nr:CheR family methyltransferase [Sulfurimonas sp. SAG-AH-194-C21]MDF1882445.1 protein-glutamate O-methyltransferase CheR [Sulfurimonas sp. SAG-AH-194-C21]
MFKFLFPKKVELIAEEESSTLNVDTKGIENLFAYIENRSGISLEKTKVLIQNKITTFCRNKNISSFQKLLDSFTHDNDLWVEFVNLITINETYFFREKGQILEALKKHTKTTDTLSILCAPSSTGEEIYSVVILALEMGITNFKVIGIDISIEAITKAKNGLYTQRSVHKIPPNTLEKYFTAQDEKYKIKDTLKRHTQFTVCNLFEDELYKLGKFDFILSRNMFIYFKDEKKLEAYQRLSRLKKELSSTIYLGHADVSSKLSEYIKSISQEG